MDMQSRLAAIPQRLFNEPLFAQSLLDSGADTRVSKAIAAEMSTWQSWPKDVPSSIPLLWLASYSMAWPLNPCLAPAFAHALTRYMDTLGTQNMAMDTVVQNQLGVGIHRAHKMWTPKETVKVIKAIAKTYTTDSKTNAYRTMQPIELVFANLSKHGTSIDSGRFKRIYYNTLEHLQKAPLEDRMSLLPWLLARDAFSIDEGVIDQLDRMHTIAMEIVPEEAAAWDTLYANKATYIQWLENTWEKVHGPTSESMPTLLREYY